MHDAAEAYLCFNSNMVRLKDCEVESNSDTPVCFNSNMVRLKEKLKKLEQNTKTVSIPIWYD